MNATIYYKNIFGDNKMTKYKILEILRENKDSFVSGEILSRKLNVSRTAVWK
ncbi:MAG: HTH domain-containing protein, partial [Fusobacterium sp.]